MKLQQSYVLSITFILYLQFIHHSSVTQRRDTFYHHFNSSPAPLGVAYRKYCTFMRNSPVNICLPIVICRRVMALSEIKAHVNVY